MSCRCGKKKLAPPPPYEELPNDNPSTAFKTAKKQKVIKKKDDEKWVHVTLVITRTSINNVTFSQYLIPWESFLNSPIQKKMKLFFSTVEYDISSQSEASYNDKEIHCWLNRLLNNDERVTLISHNKRNSIILQSQLLSRDNIDYSKIRICHFLTILSTVFRFFF